MDIYESINPDLKFLILLPHLKNLCQNLTMFIQTVSKKGLFLFISLKYIRWKNGKEEISILSIKPFSSANVHIRTAKSLKDCRLQKEQYIAMQDTIDTAANKAVAKLLYGLREHLTQDYFQVCMEALVKSAEDTKP